jgi:hypothetical protein
MIEGINILRSKGMKRECRFHKNNERHPRATYRSREHEKEEKSKTQPPDNLPITYLLIPAKLSAAGN